MRVWFLHYFAYVNVHNFFFFRYQNSHGQYAVAINVPKKQCQLHFDPFKKKFLVNDQSDQVIPNSPKVYRGQEIITAGHSNAKHSEDLLMNPPNNSPLTELMNKRKDGCVVFYTLISPCINRCLNNNHNKNIIQGLNKLRAYQGIKAFVYTYIYTNDQNNTNLSEKLQMIANLVPLYRCKQNDCILCGEPGTNTRVIDQCLTKNMFN